jgi:hypothetical protein
MEAINSQPESSDPQPGQPPLGVSQPPATVEAPISPAQPVPPTPATTSAPAPVVGIPPQPVVEKTVTNEPESTSGAKKPPKDNIPAGERGLRGLWTCGSILSILLNLILLIALLVAGNQLFALKKLVGDDLLGGLHANFVKMDNASIKTTITVNENIPVSFDLPINQNTNVVLSQDTSISQAPIKINTGGVFINAPADIILPAGTTLPIRLEMTVPVQTTIPITLNVPVDIPLNQTELHEPFKGLQDVVAPYYWLLKPDWKTCQDAPVLSSIGPACKFFFASPYNSTAK